MRRTYPLFAVLKNAYNFFSRGAANCNVKIVRIHSLSDSGGTRVEGRLARKLGDEELLTMKGQEGLSEAVSKRCRICQKLGVTPRMTMTAIQVKAHILTM